MPVPDIPTTPHDWLLWIAADIVGFLAGVLFLKLVHHIIDNR